MKKLQFIFLLTVLLGNSPLAKAAESDDLFGNDDLFGESDNSLLPTQEPAEDAGKVLSAFVSSRIPDSSARNIENAEKVFCYTVSYTPTEYNGYKIDDMAITGSCGELSTEGRSLLKDVLLHNTSAFSTSDANCEIQPRVLFRYIHGIDSTDILLSTPCHSLTFFHGSSITTLNAAPGKDIVEQIVKTYSSLEEKFLSPALLGQMVPNGQVVTQAQKEMVRKLSTSNSPKKWNNEPSQQSAPSQAENPAPSSQPVKKGWNKLK